MKKLLILYPAEFKSKSKFDRKVAKITSQMTDYGVVYLKDHSGFVAQHFEQKAALDKLETDDLDNAEITHAIVFADDEVFQDEISTLRSRGVSLRLVRIQITRVINIKKETQYAHLKSNAQYEYIGRGSYWGNPYSMFAEGDSRGEVIRKFKYDFDNDKFAKKQRSEVFKLSGKRLGCFCKPDACHGDVLADFLNAWDDGA